MLTTTRLASATVYPVLPAEDLARARSFYHETLGLEVEDMSGQFIVHAGSGTRILVYERPRTIAEHTVATFLVDDLYATMSELRSHGITFAEYDLPNLKTVAGIAESSSDLAAWFSDSEGNIINIAQMK